MTKGNFLFYESFAEMFELMPTDADKVEFIRALYQYGIYKQEVETSPLVAVALAGAKPNIDAANRRYEANVENGKKGGRPKKSETQQNPTEPTETQLNPNEPNFNETNPSEPTSNHNDNVNGNVNGNVDADVEDNADVDAKLSETSSPGETSSPSGAKPTTSSKRISRKEQLVNYVNELTYSEETKKALFSWIFQIGLNGNVTVQQLKDKLEYIWNIYHDESLVRQSIEEAYRNNWFGFFPLKNRPEKSPATLEKKEPSSFTTKYQDNNYSYENSRPARQKQQGCWNITY